MPFRDTPRLKLKLVIRVNCNSMFFLKHIYGIFLRGQLLPYGLDPLFSNGEEREVSYLLLLLLSSSATLCHFFFSKVAPCFWAFWV